MLRRVKEIPIKRDDAPVIDTTPGEGNLVRVKTPKFLSLVDIPANQVGFKVLRSDLGENPMSKQIIRRTRRSDANPVLRLTFPADTTEADVNAALQSYGLDGYTVANTEGIYTATRADLKSISNEKVQQIKLSDAGLVATIARQETGVEAPEPKSQISVPSLEFSSAVFNADSVQAWMTANGITGSVTATESAYTVKRSDIPEGEETRLMNLEDGITATVIRSDLTDVPDGFFAVISETAYGSWGWGQYDFTAMMADVAFSEQMDDAIYRLRRVLENIVLNSPLPLDIRKTLTHNALGQFGNYVNTVMDSLPRQLLVSVVRSANPEKEKMMTAVNNATGKPEAAPGNTAQAETPITRAELPALIAAGIASHLAAEAAKRSDTSVAATAAAAEPAPVAAVAAVAAPAAEGAPLLRSDLKGIMEELMKPVNETLTALKGTTVIRSAPEQLPAAGEKEVKDVFRGAFGLRNGQ